MGDLYATSHGTGGLDFNPWPSASELFICCLTVCFFIYLIDALIRTSDNRRANIRITEDDFTELE